MISDFGLSVSPQDTEDAQKRQARGCQVPRGGATKKSVRQSPSHLTYILKRSTRVKENNIYIYIKDHQHLHEVGVK